MYSGSKNYYHHQTHQTHHYPVNHLRTGGTRTTYKSTPGTVYNTEQHRFQQYGTGTSILRNADPPTTSHVINSIPIAVHHREAPPHDDYTRVFPDTDLTARKMHTGGMHTGQVHTVGGCEKSFEDDDCSDSPDETSSALTGIEGGTNSAARRTGDPQTFVGDLSCATTVGPASPEFMSISRVCVSNNTAGTGSNTSGTAHGSLSTSQLSAVPFTGSSMTSWRISPPMGGSAKTPMVTSSSSHCAVQEPRRFRELLPSNQPNQIVSSLSSNTVVSGRNVQAATGAQYAPQQQQQHSGGIDSTPLTRRGGKRSVGCPSVGLHHIGPSAALVATHRRTTHIQPDDVHQSHRVQQYTTEATARLSGWSQLPWQESMEPRLSSRRAALNMKGDARRTSHFEDYALDAHYSRRSRSVQPSASRNNNVFQQRYQQYNTGDYNTHNKNLHLVDDGNFVNTTGIRPGHRVETIGRLMSVNSNTGNTNRQFVDVGTTGTDTVPDNDDSVLLPDPYQYKPTVTTRGHNQHARQTSADGAVMLKRNRYVSPAGARYPNDTTGGTSMYTAVGVSSSGGLSRRSDVKMAVEVIATRRAARGIVRSSPRNHAGHQLDRCSSSSSSYDDAAHTTAGTRTAKYVLNDKPRQIIQSDVSKRKPDDPENRGNVINASTGKTGGGTTGNTDVAVVSSRGKWPRVASVDSTSSSVGCDNNGNEVPPHRYDITSSSSSSTSSASTSLLNAGTHINSSGTHNGNLWQRSPNTGTEWYKEAVLHSTGTGSTISNTMVHQAVTAAAVSTAAVLREVGGATARTRSAHQVTGTTNSRTTTTTTTTTATSTLRSPYGFALPSTHAGTTKSLYYDISTQPSSAASTAASNGLSSQRTTLNGLSARSGLSSRSLLSPTTIKEFPMSPLDAEQHPTGAVAYGTATGAVAYGTATGAAAYSTGVGAHTISANAINHSVSRTGRRTGAPHNDLETHAGTHSQQAATDQQHNTLRKDHVCTGTTGAGTVLEDTEGRVVRFTSDADNTGTDRSKLPAKDDGAAVMGIDNSTSILGYSIRRIRTGHALTFTTEVHRNRLYTADQPLPAEPNQRLRSSSNNFSATGNATGNATGRKTSGSPAGHHHTNADPKIVDSSAEWNPYVRGKSESTALQHIPPPVRSLSNNDDVKVRTGTPSARNKGDDEYSHHRKTAGKTLRRGTANTGTANTGTVVSRGAGRVAINSRGDDERYSAPREHTGRGPVPAGFGEEESRGSAKRHTRRKAPLLSTDSLSMTSSENKSVAPHTTANSRVAAERTSGRQRRNARSRSASPSTTSSAASSNVEYEAASNRLADDTAMQAVVQQAEVQAAVQQAAVKQPAQPNRLGRSNSAKQHAVPSRSTASRAEHTARKSTAAVPLGSTGGDRQEYRNKTKNQIMYDTGANTAGTSIKNTTVRLQRPSGGTTAAAGSDADGASGTAAACGSKITAAANGGATMGRVNRIKIVPSGVKGGDNIVLHHSPLEGMQSTPQVAHHRIVNDTYIVHQGAATFVKKDARTGLGVHIDGTSIRTTTKVIRDPTPIVNRQFGTTGDSGETGTATTGTKKGGTVVKTGKAVGPRGGAVVVSTVDNRGVVEVLPGSKVTCPMAESAAANKGTGDNNADAGPSHTGTGGGVVWPAFGTLNSFDFRSSKQGVSQFPPELLLDPSTVQFESRIGVGASAEVWKAVWRGSEVAVKILSTKTVPARLLPGDFHRELEIMTKLRHPNLVLLMGASVIHQPVCLVTEYCSGGDLYSLLHTDKPSDGKPRLTWRQRLDVARDVARGCAYLHTSRPQVIHRDLKSPNILLSQPVTSSADQCQAKITDFGLSRLTVTGEVKTAVAAGTGLWMAPELFDVRQAFDEKVDTYSFGVLLFELATSTLPYADLPDMPTRQIGNMVQNGMRPDLTLVPSDCPPSIQALMKDCWRHAPHERPSFQEILATLKTARTEIGLAP